MSMVEIELDGKKVEVPQGSMVMHAAEKAGVYIPHFCYHKKLSIAANCRMCLVDVEKAPKAMPACATPVTQDMVVRTKSDKAIKAQQSVMEFLLINHPLDCPICDQGGECQLQDLAVGYGSGASRYEEEKHVTKPKDVGPLISMEEMSRCIHCTRCVRFGQEIAGQMELGMSNRGEHSEIETFLGSTVDSELSGNMIDVCPVGALTSKPFRYNARTWELSRRKSISPHDSSGANLIVQVKNHRVMRVVPFENEAINECWIADRDRFSYEALNTPERLSRPRIKQNGEWHVVDWHTALEFVANGLRDIQAKHGANSVGLLASPHSTLEELYLARGLMQGLGSDSIDHRLRHGEYRPLDSVRHLGMRITDLNHVQHALVVGSMLRYDHPLFALRLRDAARRGAVIDVLASDKELPNANAWAMPVRERMLAAPSQWVRLLAGVAAAVAQIKGVEAPVEATADESAHAVARRLVDSERAAIFLGNAAVHHANASSLQALAQWLAEHTGAKVGFFVESANAVGAEWLGLAPKADGFNARQMLDGSCKALMLLNAEPGKRSGYAWDVKDQLKDAEMVVSMGCFKDVNWDIADVLLPIAPWTETSGTFVNAEGRAQSFHAVVKPYGETRPGWKVLRVLANLLDLPNLSFDATPDILAAMGVTPGGFLEGLSNATTAPIVVETPEHTPKVARIYELDQICRHAPSLQASPLMKREELSHG
jgi:NADH-quinone oxidoreductase subunit G